MASLLSRSSTLLRSSTSSSSSSLATVAASSSSSSASCVIPTIASQRSIHDLVIKRKTGLPIQRAGPYGGGRSSVSGHVATVFGCTGFLGRYVCDRLAQKGTQVVVPYRDEDSKRHLKVMGDLGQIVPMEWDLRSDEQIEECLRHSDVVYNLTGRFYPTKNFSYDEVNAVGAGRIAAIAANAGVSRFIHVSHINAREDSASEFMRSKAKGEKLVKQAFEGATIVRPGHLFGHEDRFLNSMASWPLTWHVNQGQTRLRPAHVINVGQALETMLDAEVTSIGETFSLAGPKTYTIEEILTIVHQLTHRKIVRAVNIPKPLLKIATKVADLAWWPMLNPDELDRRYVDDLPDEPGTKSWADLGIEPENLEDVAISYLRRYRSHLHYERPIESGGLRMKKQRYRVVD